MNVFIAVFTTVTIEMVIQLWETSASDAAVVKSYCSRYEWPAVAFLPAGWVSQSAAVGLLLFNSVSSSAWVNDLDALSSLHKMFGSCWLSFMMPAVLSTQTNNFSNLITAILPRQKKLYQPDGVWKHMSASCLRHTLHNLTCQTHCNLFCVILNVKAFNIWSYIAD